MNGLASTKCKKYWCECWICSEVRRAIGPSNVAVHHFPLARKKTKEKSIVFKCRRIWKWPFLGGNLTMDLMVCEPGGTNHWATPLSDGSIRSQLDLRCADEVCRFKYLRNGCSCEIQPYKRVWYAKHKNKVCGHGCECFCVYTMIWWIFEYSHVKICMQSDVQSTKLK